jgi:TonB family protein
MLGTDKRDWYAVVCSLFIHLMVFFVVNTTATYGYNLSNSEVFETRDYIENVDLMQAKQGTSLVKQEYDANFEMILCSEEQFKQVIVNTEEIKIPNTANAIKNKLKAAIVNAPAVSPKLLSGSPVPYPSGGDGNSGTVLVCVLVGVDGKPEYTSIAGSCGNHVLDGAAIDHCISWRFNPARDARGKPVRCLIYIPVRVER